MRPADRAEHAVVLLILQLPFAGPAAFPRAGDNELYSELAETYGKRALDVPLPWSWIRCGSSHDPK